MKERENNTLKTYYYDNTGTKQVSDQIMDAYNSGVIDQTKDLKNKQEESDSLS